MKRTPLCFHDVLLLGQPRASPRPVSPSHALRRCKAERKKKKKSLSLGSLRRRPAVSAALFPRQPPAPSLLPPGLELPPVSLPTSSSLLPLQRGDGGSHGGMEARARRWHDKGPRTAVVRWRPASSLAASSSAASISADLRARPALPLLSAELLAAEPGRTGAKPENETTGVGSINYWVKCIDEQC